MAMVGMVGFALIEGFVLLSFSLLLHLHPMDTNCAGEFLFLGCYERENHDNLVCIFFKGFSRVNSPIEHFENLDLESSLYVAVPVVVRL